MKILPDTKDLIELSSSKDKIEELRKLLSATSSQLVMTLGTVVEFARPLMMPGRRSNSRGILEWLDELDTLPRCFLPSGHLLTAELSHAAKAWRAGTEVVQMQPLADRIDKTLPRSGCSSYLFLVPFSLSDFVSTIASANPKLLVRDFLQPAHRRVRTAFAASRRLGRSALGPSRAHFADAIANHVESLDVDVVDTVAFADWLWKEPSRSPGVRLRYEVSCNLANNRADVPKFGDATDLSLVAATPYVDLISLDSRMRHYTKAAFKRLGSASMDLSGRLCDDIQDLMSRLRA